MSALDTAMQLRGQAMATKEQPNIDTTPEKTIGGGAMSALGGAGAGGAVAGAIGITNPVIGGAMVAGGALLSALGYFDS